jgi:hypothetical protein
MLVELALSYNRINEPGHQKKEKVFPKKDGNVTLLFLFSSPLKWHLPPMFWNIRLCIRTKENVPSVRNGFLGPSRIGKKNISSANKSCTLDGELAQHYRGNKIIW